MNVFATKNNCLWQQQISTCHPGDDRTAVHNDGIIVDASTSVWQEEMNGDQLFGQPPSTNPVDMTRHIDGMIINESIRVAHNVRRVGMNEFI